MLRRPPPEFRPAAPFAPRSRTRIRGSGAPPAVHSWAPDPPDRQASESWSDWKAAVTFAGSQGDFELNVSGS